ncbi:J domain-containing protein [Inconstantimicrobium porci]|uniref:Tetratricopeptide repeat protein n=1 Tax=Inconstantimicrobium porci TaxID=2652291 RepID=A0A7X2T1W2_9CLOT|nr:J domain-containing protein [Inconstantimicrobium porci]MSR92027.1 tetratricopeptide repeat protein [Inconstantimicrobium porci]
MNKWAILGIKPTNDKDKLKEAYFDKLSVVNPEDDEEGFKQLRNAYESLLKDIDNQDELDNQCEDDNQLSLWLKKVDYVYSRFSQRISCDDWEQLLKDDICFCLDTKEDASMALLEYLMDHCFMPQKIWVLLNQHFGWMDNKQDLYEEFPEEGFIDYVEHRIEYADSLNYELFSEIDDSNDYDEWIRLYYQISRELRENKTEQIEKDFAMMQSLNIKHPYQAILNIKYLVLQSKLDEAATIAENLIQRYSDEPGVIYAMAKVRLHQENYNEALKYYKMMLDITPDNYNCLRDIADCKLSLGDYEEAKKIYHDLIDRNNYDKYVRGQLEKVNDKIIQLMKGDFDKSNSDKMLKLGWCLYENGRYDEILDLVKSVDKEDEARFYNLLGRTYKELNRYSEALEYYKKCCYILENEDKQGRHLPYIYGEIGKMYAALEEYEKAIEYCDKALDMNHEDIAALDLKACALAKMEQYKESLKYFDKCIDINDKYFEVLLHRSNLLSELGYDADALSDAEKAEELEPRFSECYVMQMKLYCEHEQFDDALEVYHRAEEYDAVTDKTKLYRAKAVFGKRKNKKAKTILNEILNNIEENGDTCKILAEVYGELALVYSKLQKSEQADEYINKAIEIAPENPHLYNKAGIIFDNKRKWETAIEYYKKAIEIMGDRARAEFFTNIALSFIKLKQYDEAINYYGQAIELYPHNSELYVKKARAHELIKQYDEAMELYEECLEFDDYNKDYINHKLEELYEIKNKELQHFFYEYRNAARECEHDGNKEKAAQLYKMALDICDKITNKDASQYTEMAECCRALGDLEKVIFYCNMCKEHMCCKSKECFDSLYVLAGAYEDKKDYENALECYYRIIESEGSDDDSEKAIKRIKKTMMKKNS